MYTCNMHPDEPPDNDTFKASDSAGISADKEDWQWFWCHHWKNWSMTCEVKTVDQSVRASGAGTGRGKSKVRPTTSIPEVPRVHQTFQGVFTLALRIGPVVFPLVPKRGGLTVDMYICRYVMSVCTNAHIHVDVHIHTHSLYKHSLH